MIPTSRTAALIAGLAVLVIFVPAGLVALAVVAVVTVAAADARAVRRSPHVRRELATVLSRGVPAPLRVDVREPRALVRQPMPPDLDLGPRSAEGTLEAVCVPRRRGRHAVPPPAVALTGPLGLGGWVHPSCGEGAEVLVYPDLPAARAIALAVRQGKFREPGRMRRGPLGLGTEFESIRDYLPDDDIRQVNWKATARLGRPMSNQFRVEQDRDVVCVIDSGRLMGAPLTDRTRLDAAVDAATTVAFVADEVGDRCGVIAFDAAVRRRLRPRRSGGDAVVRAIFDLEPTHADSDYQVAFRAIGPSKRAFVLVLTDLLDEGAARPLVAAIPYLARRHAVAVASASDPDLEGIVGRVPRDTKDVYAAAAALDVLGARTRVASLLRAAGAVVVEAPPARLGAACVGAYLRARSRARL